MGQYSMMLVEDLECAQPHGRCFTHIFSFFPYIDPRMLELFNLFLQKRKLSLTEISWWGKSSKSPFSVGLSNSEISGIIISKLLTLALFHTQNKTDTMNTVLSLTICMLLKCINNPKIERQMVFNISKSFKSLNITEALETVCTPSCIPVRLLEEPTERKK